MNVVTRFGTTDPTVCAVCRRRATGLGYAPKQSQRIIWLCDNHDCHSLGAKVYKMPDKYLDAYENGARIEATDAAGSFLAEIGNFDMSKLSEPELAEFGRRFIVTFEHSLRNKIMSGEAPF